MPDFQKALANHFYKHLVDTATNRIAKGSHSAVHSNGFASDLVSDNKRANKKKYLAGTIAEEINLLQHRGYLLGMWIAPALPFCRQAGRRACMTGKAMENKQGIDRFSDTHVPSCQRDKCFTDNAWQRENCFAALQCG